MSPEARERAGRRQAKLPAAQASRRATLAELWQIAGTAGRHPKTDSASYDELAEAGRRQAFSERITQATTHVGLNAGERIIQHTMDATMGIHQHLDRQLQDNDLSAGAARGFAEAAKRILQEGNEHLRNIASDGICSLRETIRERSTNH